MYRKDYVRTEIGLDPKQDWAQTQAAPTINLQSVDERTRSIPEEKTIKFGNLRLLDTNRIRKSVIGITREVYIILSC